MSSCPMSSRQRLSAVIGLSAVLLSCHQVTAHAAASDTSPSPESAEKDTASGRSADRPDPFTVPAQASAEELLDFIRSVKRRRPGSRNPDAVAEHIRRQVEAIDQAAAAIQADDQATDRQQLMAVEERFVAFSLLARVDPATAWQKVVTLNRAVRQDPRPVFVDVADFHLMQAGISKIRREHGEPDDMVTELSRYIDQHGIDPVVLGFAESLGTRLSRSGHDQAAARLFHLLIDAVRRSDSEELKQDLPFLTSTARRLSLPGNVLKLTGTTAEGQPFNWNSYRGRYVLVQFWATWCGPCRAEIPEIRRQLDRYGERGFDVVGVNLDEDPAAFAAFMKETELPWTNIVPDADGTNPNAEYYAITSLPTLLLVDPDGRVISTDARGETLSRLLAEHLGPPDSSPEEPRSDSSP